MNKDVYEKALFEMDKVVKTLNDFDKLPGDKVRDAVVGATHAMDTFVSSILGQTTVVKEFLVLSDEVKAKRLVKEFCNHYFVLRTLGQKRFKKTSRDAVRVFGWKNTDATSKGELIGMLLDIKKLMSRIWRAQK